jgi:hypothetical protein
MYNKALGLDLPLQSFKINDGPRSPPLVNLNVYNINLSGCTVVRDDFWSLTD